jgi:hypothetical protein
MKREEKEKKISLVLRDIKYLAGKHGVETLRRAVRRWDKGVTQKKALLKEKRRLDQEIKSLNRKLK